MNAQECYDKLEPRLRTVETFTWWAKGGIAVAAVAFGGMVAQAVYIFFALNKDVAVMENRVSTSERDHSKLESALKEHGKRHDELLAAHNKVREDVVVLVATQPKRLSKGFETVLPGGKVVSVSADHITILPKEIDQPAFQFPFAKTVVVRIDDRVGTIKEIKYGMDAVLEPGGEKGEVTRVEIYTTEWEKKMKENNERARKLPR